MSTKVRRITGVLAVATTVVVVAAGCSSSGGSNPPSTSNSGGGGSSSTTSDASPILIGSSGSLSNPAYSEPQLQSGLDAAVSDINAAGGIEGHPLKLDFCDSDYDANKELACARQLISEHVVASVHPSILADTTGAEFKLYQQANIPVFGGLGLSPAEVTNPDSYPLGSGDAGWFAGAAKALKLAGATKVVIYADSNPGSQYSASLIPTSLKSLGLQNNGIVTADPKADPTFATSAAKAVANGTNGIVLTPGPVNLPGMVKALYQAGYTGKIATIDTLMTFGAIPALGKEANGILLSSQFAFPTDTSNPGVAKFLADMKKYQPKAIVDDTSLSGWSAVMLFAKILETSKSSTLDNTAFKNALDNLSKPIDIGTVAPYAVKGRVSPYAAAPRILNPTVSFGEVKNGKIVSNGQGFSNAFTS